MDDGGTLGRQSPMLARSPAWRVEVGWSVLGGRQRQHSRARL